MSKFIVTDAFKRDGLGMALCEASGIEPTTVRRLVLDLRAGSPGMLYVETFADTEILNVEIPAGIQIETA